MTSAAERIRRAHDFERWVAEQLHGVRVVRERGESAPDVLPVTFPNGVSALLECKRRKELPALLMGWLAQARAYIGAWWRGRGVIHPVAVIRESGPRARVLVVCELEAFRQLVGLAPVPPPPVQGALPLAPPANDRGTR